MPTITLPVLSLGVWTEGVLDLSGGLGATTFLAKASGTGYTVGDTLLCNIIVSKVSPFTFTQHWVNLNTGLAVSPSMADLQVVGALGQKAMAQSAPVVIASDQSAVPVSGTFYPATQPISGSVSVSGSVAVTGTFWQATQPVSAASLPLPTGAATAAKQPAFSTVGTSSADVITVQGAAGAVAIPTSMSSLPGSEVASGSADSGNPHKIGGRYNSTLPTVTNAQRVDLQLDNHGRIISSPDAGVATYSAAFIGQVTTVNATDVFALFGSASKKIVVTKIGFNGTQTTAGTLPVSIIKRTAANTGGTSSAVTAAKHDSASAAASATCVAYTANPSALGAGSNVRTRRVFAGTATSLFNTGADFSFCENGAKGIILNGTGEGLVINLNSTSAAGNSCGIYVEWTEE